jgi:mannosyltransferase
VGVVADISRARLTTDRPGIGRLTRVSWILVGLTAVAAGLRFARLGHQSFWYDESFTVLLVHHSPARMLGLLPQTELTPPLYYCVLWVWAHIFGFGEVGLRSLSALAGVATVFAMYAAGAKLISPRVGLVAAALSCFNPLLIWYSQEARSYALLILLAALSLLAFAGARLPNPSSRQLLAWALLASLTLLTHYYAVVAVVPQAVWLLWVHRGERRVLLAIAAVGAVGLALVPLAINQQPKADWIPLRALDRRLSQIAPQFLLGTGAPARTILKLGGAAAVLLSGVLLVRRADPSERRTGLLAGGLALAGFLIALGLVAVGIDQLITRNLVLALIPLIVLIAAGLGARRAGILGLLGASTLCMVGLVAAIAVAVDWRLQRPNWQGLAGAIGAGEPSPGGRAILFQDTPLMYPLPLYMPGLRFIRAPGAWVREFDVIAATHSPREGWFCWWGSTCNVRRSRLDRSIRLRGFPRHGAIVRFEEFLVLRLRSSRPVLVRQADVSAAFRRSAKNVPFYSLMVQPQHRVHVAKP